MTAFCKSEGHVKPKYDWIPKEDLVNAKRNKDDCDKNSEQKIKYESVLTFIKVFV